MKLIFLILFSTFAFSEESVGKKELNFASTFPEGFGVFMKKELVVIKSKTDLDALYKVNSYKILSDKNELIPLIFYNSDCFKKIEKIFLKNEKIKCEIICYEVIGHTGLPDLNKTVADNELLLTKDTGIEISKKIVLVDIKVL